MSSSLEIEEPLVFRPIFKERVWGGRRLQELFGKELPEGRIGESWEIVDRADDQSVVLNGALAGHTLHELWTEHRSAIFGKIADGPRFPLLIKLLDAADKLSLQVHPGTELATEMKAEPKTEFWYIAHAVPGAELYVGLKRHSSQPAIEEALQTGTVEDHVHRCSVCTGDAMFLPSGRMHAIGAGNVIVEIQQNSDTTYRVFDWNRVDADGEPRELHVTESLRAIDFEDYEPALVRPAGETLVRDPLFHIEKWTLTESRL
ncbi:MAG TPA: type I phosphomannose isomerase catalytic subunit, partial [Chthoniobacterales bacterium]